MHAHRTNHDVLPNFCIHYGSVAFGRVPGRYRRALGYSFWFKLSASMIFDRGLLGVESTNQPTAAWTTNGPSWAGMLLADV